MGGDNAPGEIVKGAVDAVTERKDITVCLTGQKDVIEKELSKYTYKIEQIEIVDAPEVIETGEPPVNAIRKKKNSSLVVGLNLVKNGESGRLCICRKLRSCSRWRTGHRRTCQRCGTPAVSTAYSYGKGSLSSDRLRRKR